MLLRYAIIYATRAKENLMDYLVTVSYEDKDDVVHTIERGAWTAEDGVYFIYEELEPIMTDWPSINPYGVLVNASVESDDGDFCDTYEFKLGM